MSKFIELLEDYFEFREGDKITIISEVEENEETCKFRYCLFWNFTETGDSEISKKDFVKWLNKNNKLDEEIK